MTQGLSPTISLSLSLTKDCHILADESLDSGLALQLMGLTALTCPETWSASQTHRPPHRSLHPHLTEHAHKGDVEGVTQRSSRRVGTAPGHFVLQEGSRGHPHDAPQLHLDEQEEGESHQVGTSWAETPETAAPRRTGTAHTGSPFATSEGLHHQLWPSVHSSSGQYVIHV